MSNKEPTESAATEELSAQLLKSNKLELFS